VESHDRFNISEDVRSTYEIDASSRWIEQAASYQNRTLNKKTGERVKPHNVERDPKNETIKSQRMKG
jgi:hypothetical protein